MKPFQNDGLFKQLVLHLHSDRKHKTKHAQVEYLPTLSPFVKYMEQIESQQG